MAKTSAKRQEPSSDEPGFEESMARLEEVVEAMQSPDLPLDQVIERYEEGMKLITVCTALLEAAEQKIELLTREKSGEFAPATGSDQAGSGASANPSLDDEDEASLF